MAFELRDFHKLESNHDIEIIHMFSSNNLSSGLYSSINQ